VKTLLDTAPIKRADDIERDDASASDTHDPTFSP